jgi:hypothetical protein
MKYPTELSTEAQASVEHERILAEEEFDTARAGLRSNFEKALAQLIRRYVIRVVLAFAKEACKLGRNRVWPASQVESEVHSFMEQVARKANAEKRFYSNGEYLEGF